MLMPREIVMNPLPDYSGAAWRGVFGHALKQLVCVTRERNCLDCLLYRSCVYPYIFEAPPDPAVGIKLKPLLGLTI
jgi:hypothetical protein